MTEIVAAEKLSEAEERFERGRKRVGFVAAPIVFIAMLLLPMPALTPQAHRLAAVMATVIVLWLTEAVAMPVSALLGAAACVVLRVAPAEEVFAPFANPLIFLFIGGFILARAIFLYGLDRRFAFAVLSIRGVGGRPTRIMFAFGAVTAFVSAWVSNTATTAMMFAIGLSILKVLFDQEKAGGPRINRNYATGLMLMTAFAASIGGLATPIGTAPNVIGLGLIQRSLDVRIPFLKWCMIGVPIVIVLYLWLAAYLNYFCRAGVREIPGTAQLLQRERERLARWSRGEISTLIAFAITVFLWILPGAVALARGENSDAYKQLIAVLPEGVVALLGALLLFILPGTYDGRAINWREAVQIDWGVVLLYGGGLTLGVLSFNTGLADAVGTGLTRLLPIHGSPTVMLIAACLVAVIVSETTSNTASATMVVPVVIALAKGAGVDPLEPALGATMAASLGFMLPVSTPCNAIVYGSGYIPIGKMVKYGLLLDIVGVIVVVVVVKLLVPLVR
ncbi:MAG: solute carrier family 13 (sodium-dependent dicarboxylate transporter), er 2/3/5 [Phycisphaerales bacterium]|jgi:sodium-dependent dicarboxylate transporter 2/3/5|nr:solute carrier family 13 (sodium-dependent dicarboxylate transporter), er 2/3/5 [Phycisphaerales bacterium]